MIGKTLRRKPSNILCFLTAWIPLLTATHAQGVEVTLAWDRPADMTGIAGFHLYHGTSSGNYTTVLDAGTSTTKTVLLPAAGTYYFAATSYDASGLESEFSNEVVFQALEQNNTAPALSTIAPQVLAMSSSSSVIGFTVSDAETAADGLAITVSSSSATLLPTSGILLGGSGSSRTIKLTPAAGQTGSATVTVRVSDGSMSAATSFLVTVLPPPSIVLTAPTTTSFTAPATVSIAASVTSNGNEILKVGFYRGTTLILEDATAPYACTWSSAGAGTYSLTARVYPKIGSSRTSASRTIYISDPPLSPVENTPPSISALGSQAVAMSTSSSVLSFTVSDASTPSEQLVVTAVSSNTTLLPSSGLVLGGSGSLRTIQINPATGQTGSATVTVRVSDGSLSASTSFTITVLPRPSVVLTSPSTSASYIAPATLGLTASVTSNGNQILKVGFYRGTTLIREDTTAPYSYTWSQVAAGNYSITARVYPKVGSSVASGARSVTVANPLPTITLTSPSSGATFSAPASVTLAASVVANGHTINKVRFFNGSTLLAEDTTSPYSYTWNNAGQGTYGLSASVVYNSTQTVSSGSRTITISPPAIGPILLQAADAVVAAPFYRNNGAIRQDTSTGVTDGGRAEFSFYVPTTTNYIVDFDVDAPGTQANSFFVNVDAEPEDPVMVWPLSATEGFQWSTLSWRGTMTTIASIAQYSPKIFNLTAGTHKLIVRGRAAYTQFKDAKLTPISGVSGSWRSTTVGSPGSPGVASISGGDYTVLGAGTIGGTADGFHYLYQSLTGDGELRARVTSTAISSGQVGIMIRENLTSGSKYVMMSLSPSRTFRWSCRTTASGSTTTRDAVAATVPYTWLRLVRTGTTLTGYYSVDGRNWVGVGTVSTMTLASNIYFGLVSSSGGTGLNTTVFQGVIALP